jgi:hypothetical protein
MNAPDVLDRSVRRTHDHLAARLDSARGMTSTRGQPRKGFEDIDTFLAIASRHLNAVDAALLPEVRRSVPEGARLVHDYVRSERHLELALAHVKARAYGSTYDVSRTWASVWADVETALVAHRDCETTLAGALTAALEPASLDAVAERLEQAESHAPSRPHPYAPHTGLAGQVSRRVMHTVDAFWDTAEGRMVPTPERPTRGRPGKVWQYLLADPRFDEEEPEDEPEQRA